MAVYWNGSTFPFQGGKAVFISEADFVECCCEPPVEECDEGCIEEVSDIFHTYEEAQAEIDDNCDDY